jgi:hypothetical protein
MGGGVPAGGRAWHQGLCPAVLRGSELVGQCPLHGGDVQESGVERLIGAGNFGHPGGVFGVVGASVISS